MQIGDNSYWEVKISVNFYQKGYTKVLPVTTYREAYIGNNKEDVGHLEYTPQLSPGLQVQLEVAQLILSMLLKHLLHVLL